MPLEREHRYTVEDIYQLPEGRRAELIDGVMYDMAPPGFRHQKLVSELTQRIGAYIKSRDGGCEVLPAPFAVFLNQDDKTYVEPDISVICDPEKLTETGCQGAPDFVIEIVSPSSRRMDYVLKHALYSAAGVREYWIVDPEKQRTTVYYYEEDLAPIVYPFTSTIRCRIYEDLAVRMEELLH